MRWKRVWPFLPGIFWFQCAGSATASAIEFVLCPTVQARSSKGVVITRHPQDPILPYAPKREARRRAIPADHSPARKYQF
jgi:hypothetical protein